MAEFLDTAQISVAFWPEREVLDLESRIVLLFKGDTNPVGRFPGEEPNYDDLLAELEQNRTCWVSRSRPKAGGQFEASERSGLNLLAGRLLVHAQVTQSEGHPRLQLRRRNGIEFASNYLRARVLSEGRAVSHHGITCMPGPSFHSLETKGDKDASASEWKAGQFVTELVEGAEDGAPAKAPSEPLLSAGEQRVLATLREYVDAQFELEEVAARALAPFFFTGLRAEARPHVYRQYLRVRLEAESAQRYRREPVPRLKLELGEGEGLPLQLEGEVSKDGSILGSVAQQVDIQRLPKSGSLVREANATTHRTCSKVLDALAAGSHPWLTKVAALEYRAPPFTVPAHEPSARLNPSQANAVAVGKGTPDYVLVLGPPGTGKTTVILDWVEHFVFQEGKRVLIASMANKAVDNVLERLIKRPNIECVRIGNESAVMGTVKHLLIESKAHAIQSKLIERSTAAHAQLSKVIEWLSALRAVTGEYSKLERSVRVSKAELQLWAARLPRLSAQREQSRLGVLSARSVLEQREEACKRLRARRARIGTRGIWLIWGLLMRALIAVSSWWAERKRAAASSALIRATEAETRTEQQLSEARAAQATAEQGLTTAHTRRDALVPGRPDLAERVCLGLEELPEDVAAAERVLGEELGRLERIQLSVAKFRTEMSDTRQEGLLPLLLSLVDVVGATCIGIASKPEFRDTLFDVVIIDESAQIQLHNLMVPLSRGAKAILVGDHKQLPPVVTDEVADELEERGTELEFLEQSWFEKLWGEAHASRKCMLDTQFRCPSVISDYISEAFYDSKYYAGQGMAEKQPLLARAKSCLLFIDTSHHRRRGETSSNAGGRLQVLDNPLETRLVISVLVAALAEHPDLFQDPEGVAVIVPYKNHLARIQAALKQAIREGELPEPALPVTDLVASVDSFQGQERRLVIFSMSRSNAGGVVGFLKDARRLNVAMTRAKQQLVLIADVTTLTLSQKPVDLDFTGKMRALVEYTRKRAHYMSAADWLASS